MHAAREDVRLLAPSTGHPTGRLETDPIDERIGMLRRRVEESGRATRIGSAPMARIPRARASS